MCHFYVYTIKSYTIHPILLNTCSIKTRMAKVIQCQNEQAKTNMHIFDAFHFLSRYSNNQQTVTLRIYIQTTSQEQSHKLQKDLISKKSHKFLHNLQVLQSISLKVLQQFCISNSKISSYLFLQTQDFNVSSKLSSKNQMHFSIFIFHSKPAQHEGSGFGVDPDEPSPCWQPSDQGLFYFQLRLYHYILPSQHYFNICHEVFFFYKYHRLRDISPLNP